MLLIFFFTTIIISLPTGEGITCYICNDETPFDAVYDEDCGRNIYQGNTDQLSTVHTCYTQIFNDGFVYRGFEHKDHEDGTCEISDSTTKCYCNDNKCNMDLCEACTNPTPQSTTTTATTAKTSTTTEVTTTAETSTTTEVTTTAKTSTTTEVISTSIQPIECPNGWIELNDNCYAFILDEKYPWEEARNQCQNLGGDLAVIHDVDQYMFLMWYITVNGLHVPDRWSYFIGGSDKLEEGTWLWMDDEPMAMGGPYWGAFNGTNEPAGGQDQNCAELNKDNRYLFHDGQCNLYGYPLCQYKMSDLRHNDMMKMDKSRLDNCPDDWEAVGSQCYIFMLEDQYTWNESRQQCQAMGGDLAIIANAEELAFLVWHITVKELEVPDRWSYFIGGTDTAEEGNWLWIDGTPITMGAPVWGAVNGVAEPSGGMDQNCAELNKADRYFIHDGQCDQYGYPLCQYFSAPFGQ
ncbi:unnamed protein product [Meganyctiphanes norvegica]|uniref:C-type lectin domain-containing protein n=1 Tax=Meganyctiphanes norvegica TaxID=48144 RepID=A0AAV2QW63_MEGNR